jgi:hypothetical protein
VSSLRLLCRCMSVSTRSDVVFTKTTYQISGCNRGFLLTVGTSLSGSSDSDVRLSALALAVVSEKTSVDTGTLEILNNLYADCSNVVVGMEL